MRFFAFRSSATKDDSASNTPHPGKRTMLLRKRNDPLSVWYWSLICASTWPR